MCVRLQPGVQVGESSHGQEETARSVPSRIRTRTWHGALIHFADSSFEGNGAILRGGGIALEGLTMPQVQNVMPSGQILDPPNRVSIT